MTLPPSPQQVEIAVLQARIKELERRERSYIRTIDALEVIIHRSMEGGIKSMLTILSDARKVTTGELIIEESEIKV